MKVYTKIEAGKPIFSSCKSIELDGRWISNPTPEMIAAAGWEEYQEPQPELSDEEKLVRAKLAKLAEINEYDTSGDVDVFYYMGQAMWFDKATRVGLMNAVQIQKNAGMEQTTIWNDEMPITLPIDTAIMLLSAIELYALECYNVTARHKAEISALESIEEIEAYDITEGYPPALNLGIAEAEV